MAVLCREVIGDGVEVAVCLGLQQVQRQLTAADEDTRWLDPRTLGDDGSPEGEFGAGKTPLVPRLAAVCAADAALAWQGFEVASFLHLRLQQHP